MHITMTSQPVDLGPDTVIHLSDNLDIAPLGVTPAFWTHASPGHPQLSQGRILSVFDYSTTWSYWERHPLGDEVVYLLLGDVEFQLDDNRQRQTVALHAGQAAIVPAGTWHRAVIHAPSRLLFITPTPARTEQRPA